MQSVTGNPSSVTHTYADGHPSRTITAQATNEDGTFTANSHSVAVNGVAPTATFTADTPVFEGDTATVQFSNPFDPSPADTAAGLTYSYDLDNDGTFEIAGSTATTAAVPLQYTTTAGVHTVKARIYDKDGLYTEYTAVITVLADPEPELTVTGEGSGVRGQTRHFTFKATDTPADVAAGFDYHVDWDGDGTFDEVIEGDAVEEVAHVFTHQGTYNVRVKAADQGGSFSAVQALTVEIHVWQIQGDTLIVGGSTGDDEINVKPDSDPDYVRVTINETEHRIKHRGTFGPNVASVIVYAQAGNDDVKVSDELTLTAELHGGCGDDRLRGGSGNDVLLGGEGDDLLVGNDGRDLLIGGVGEDRILGNSNDDILIAGATTHDANSAALRSILAEWTSSRTYEERVQNLIDGTGAGVRFNANHFLNAMTVYDDGVSDVFNGEGGRDWFLDNSSGGVLDRTDASVNEVCTDLDLLFLSEDC